MNSNEIARRLESFAQATNLPWVVMVSKLDKDTGVLLYGRTAGDKQIAAKARDQLIKALTGPPLPDEKPLVSLPVLPPDSAVSFPNGPTMSNSTYAEFLLWLHERMVNVHGENPNADYMHRLRELASSIVPFNSSRATEYLDGLLIADPDSVSTLTLSKLADGRKIEVWPSKPE